MRGVRSKPGPEGGVYNARKAGIHTHAVRLATAQGVRSPLKRGKRTVNKSLVIRWPCGDVATDICHPVVFGRRNPAARRLQSTRTPEQTMGPPQAGISGRDLDQWTLNRGFGANGREIRRRWSWNPTEVQESRGRRFGMPNRCMPAGDVWGGAAARGNPPKFKNHQICRMEVRQRVFQVGRGLRLITLVGIDPGNKTFTWAGQTGDRGGVVTPIPAEGRMPPTKPRRGGWKSLWPTTAENHEEFQTTGGSDA